MDKKLKDVQEMWRSDINASLLKAESAYPTNQRLFSSSSQKQYDETVFETDRQSKGEPIASDASLLHLPERRIRKINLHTKASGSYGGQTDLPILVQSHDSAISHLQTQIKAMQEKVTTLHVDKA